MPSRLPLVDFHNHFVDPSLPLSAGRNQAGAWADIWRLVQDPAGPVASIDGGDIDARVLNSPASLVVGNGDIPDDLVVRLNDTLADLVSRRPGKLFGLVGVDIFAGDRAAREIERGIRDLGFRGVFVDSAKGDLLIDAPEARPGLAVAQQFGVPVFVHPINPPGLTERAALYGRLGTRIARGTINSLALAALLEGGVFDDLPDLQVVVTTLAAGAILLAAGFDEGGGIRRDTDPALRRNVHVDTMGLHPALLRVAVDLLGADHVLLGTDWPIVDHEPIRGRVEAAFAAAGLSQDEQRLIAHGNAARLLGLTSFET